MQRLSIRSLISGWDPNPFPNLSLSAAGLLVLADLHTIAQRTAITGGSSWLDALVLAPGLHYQQAADALDRESGPGLFAELARATSVYQPLQQPLVESQYDEKTPSVALPLPLDALKKFAINNTATVNYLRRLFRDQGGDDQVVTIDVRSLIAAKKAGYSLSRSMSDLIHKTQEAAAANNDNDGLPDFSFLSHFLFLASPIFTVISLVLTIILEEWWGLSIIIALMLSRLLNIYAIKKRSETGPKGSQPVREDSETAHQPTEYTIDLGMGRRVILRGSEGDLQAVTTQSWMRNKTNVEGYLEAAAKLIVYMVAAFSGNMSQAGSFILMGLLLLSAGCLGLSNAHADGFKMHGRVARPERRGRPRKGPSEEDKNRPVIGVEEARRLSEYRFGSERLGRRVTVQEVLDAEEKRLSDMSREARRQMYMNSVHHSAPVQHEIADGS